MRDLLARVEPARGVEVESFDQARGAHPQLGGQRSEHLEARRRNHGPQSQLGRRPRQPREEQGLRLLAGQAGEPRSVAVDQLDAAVGPAFGVDRHAGGAEGVDVTVNRPLGDLELARQDGGSRPTARLQKEKELYQA